MGQSTARPKRGRKETNSDEDVKRQVDSDESNQRAVYQLVDVKTGGGKLIELVKTSARRRSMNAHHSSGSAAAAAAAGASSSSSSLGAQFANFKSKAGARHSYATSDTLLDEQIRKLVEPLLYNGGRGKLVPLRQLWRARFGEKNFDDESECNWKGAKQQQCWVCWRLEERGFVGETALHICFLLSTASHMILAQKLLELFPMLIYDVYTNDEYFGESCLHMAIVNEDIVIVKWLLDKGASLHARCLGSFFLPLDQRDARATNARARRLLTSLTANTQSDHTNELQVEPDWQANELEACKTNYQGYCYWGEYPLSFAASLGLADCYRLLLAKGADPNRRDSNGNAALHMCVIADRLDMFDLCYANGANLELVNGERLSPLALAAKLERVQMFFHILAIRRQSSWLLCQVSFQQVPLAGLDTIDARDGSFDERSLLCIVVSGASID